MINPRIKGLKINNYIKKIKELLVNFSEINIMHADDISVTNKMFIQNFQTDNIFVTEFPIFDHKNNRYLESMEKVKEKAFEALKQNLNIFEEFRKIRFTYNFNGEVFIVECFYNEINEILSILPRLPFPITVYNKEKTI